MRVSVLYPPFLALPLVVLCGCGGDPAAPSTSNPKADAHAAAAEDAHDDHGHTHGAGDELFWQRRNLEHAGCRIDLGHHGVQIYGGHELEPAVAILRDGEPVDDAKVFVSLLDFEKLRVLAAEAGTIYEPPTAAEPAHYAQGPLQVPEGSPRAVLRYRIVLPDAEPFVYDVPVEVRKH
jgi:hypothetical protein